MAFKTQAEIYQALLDGKKIKRKTWAPEAYIHLVEGGLVDEFGDNMEETRLFPPHEFLIYEEPKPKKKVTLYRHTMSNRISGNIYQTTWDSVETAVDTKFIEVIKTESKEVEYDDV